MRKAFFTYQLSNIGLWESVIFYDAIPTAGTGKSKEDVPILSNTTPVDTNDDGEVFESFATYQRWYPLDEQKRLQNETIRTRLNKFRRKSMVRPVEGFQTSQGKFFETEAQADLYENGFILHQALSGRLREANPAATTEAVAEGVAQILEVLKDNYSVTSKYVEAVRTIAEKEITSSGPAADDGGIVPAGGIQAPEEVAADNSGQAAGGNPPDDTSLRDDEGDGMEGETITQAELASAGGEMEQRTIREFNERNQRRVTKKKSKVADNEPEAS